MQTIPLVSSDPNAGAREEKTARARAVLFFSKRNWLVRIIFPTMHNVQNLNFVSAHTVHDDVVWMCDFFTSTRHSTVAVDVWHFAEPFGGFCNQVFHFFGGSRVFLRDVINDFNQIPYRGILPFNGQHGHPSCASAPLQRAP